MVKRKLGIVSKILKSKPFSPDKFRKYNTKQTPKISNLVVSKYKKNKDFIKIVVYFDDTISSFSIKMSYKQCC